MIQKAIGLYKTATAASPFQTENLYIEVAAEHMACWVKDAKQQHIHAIEVFKAELSDGDWEELMYELRTQSQLLDKSYDNTFIFYNTHETVQIPSAKFSLAHATDYLELLAGANDQMVVKYDKLQCKGESLCNVYRIDARLQKSVERNFLSIKEKHTYTGILETFNDDADLLTQGNSMVVNFYKNFFIAVVLKRNQLQIIQQYSYTTAEDVLYGLLRLAQVYKIAAEADPLIVSGMIDLQGDIAQQLKRNFHNFSLIDINDKLFLFDSAMQYPAHYFTPFVNLQS